jgi:hypothetical protein
MKMKLPIVAVACSLVSSALAQDQSGRIAIDLEKPGVTVSPQLYGVFFEEINRAGDGGIYAEMVQNRSFEDNDFPVAWKAENAVIALDKNAPLNVHNPTSLRVEASAGGRVINGGFVGDGPRGNWREWQKYFEQQPGQVAVESGKRYDLSLYARTLGPTTLTVSLLAAADGRTLASQRIDGLAADWKRLAVGLTPDATDANARLVIASDEPGTFWLDMVSLFPHDTWKGRKNGLRPDLMEMIAAMKPAFVRFPGGCYVEGNEIENRFRWKETIGDVAERPGHSNANWGYRSSDGLGYHEYLEMCENLSAEPLFVINCGMSHHNGRLNAYAVPMDQMAPYVQDAPRRHRIRQRPGHQQMGRVARQERTSGTVQLEVFGDRQRERRPGLRRTLRAVPRRDRSQVSGRSTDRQRLERSAEEPSARHRGLASLWRLRVVPEAGHAVRRVRPQWS